MKNKLFYLNLLLVLLILFISCRNNDKTINSSINQGTSNNFYYEDDNFSFKYVSNEGYYLNDIYTKETSIIIPNTINNFPVVGILNHAFYNKSYITNISLPSSLEYVEDYTFYHLPNLKYQEHQSGLYLGNDKNPFLVLIDTKNKNITSLTIHSSCKIILDAFIGCDKLNKIILPSSLIYIQSDAFLNLDKLSPSIYKNGYYLGNDDNPFLVLLSLINKNESTFKINPNTHFILNSFYECKKLKEIIIPQNVLSIGKYGFYSCINLNKITLNRKIKRIDSYAFLECESLTNIFLPPSITSLKIGTFANCYKLSKVTLSENLKIIEDYVFYSCHNLKELIIPSNMDFIAKEAFYGNDQLSLFFTTPLPKEHYIDYWINNNIICNY